MGDAQPGLWAVFYKEPLEEPVQTLQPGLGFLTWQRSVAWNFNSCKNIFSAFPNNKKKSRLPSQLFYLQAGCWSEVASLLESVLAFDHPIETTNWTLPWNLFTWSMAVPFYNLPYTRERTLSQGWTLHITEVHATWDLWSLWQYPCLCVDKLSC